MARSVVTQLMFEGAAEEAMSLYVSLFKGSEITRVERYGPGEQAGIEFLAAPTALGLLETIREHGLSRFGRSHIAYGRAGTLGYVTIAAVGVVSVLLAYWKTRGYA